MGLTIGIPGAVADASSAATTQTIGIALQAQVESAQTADVEALFGSLGLGTNTDTFA